MNISIVVQFYPWFKFYFPLFQPLYHTLPYSRIKENKIQNKDKIEAQNIQGNNTDWLLWRGGH